jgi:hypothetical protein
LGISSGTPTFMVGCDANWTAYFDNVLLYVH